MTDANRTKDDLLDRAIAEYGGIDRHEAMRELMMRDDEIVRLTAERDELKRKLTEAQQLAVRQGNEIRRLQRACGEIAGRQQS